MNSLKILITNITLAGYSGTEVVVRDLALSLKKLGHAPMVYSPHLGGASNEIIHAGIIVVSDLKDLPQTPDIIHGHHHIETVQAILHFPHVPAIFVCHDAKSWHDIPPKIPAIQRFVAVDKRCYERMNMNYGIDANDISLIFNWADLTRFAQRDVLPEKPKNALVFSSYAKSNTHLQMIEETCKELQLPLDVIGFGVAKGTTTPEKLIKNYDLIFAKAKCAIEALATGAAVILCDADGLGEMVTTTNVHHFREWNFGIRLLTQPLTKNNILAEIKKYSVNDASNVTAIIRAQSSLAVALNQYLSLYKSVIKNWWETKRIGPYLSIKPYSKHLLKKINILEHITKQPFLMEPLPLAECEKIKLSSLDIPLFVNANQYFQGTLEIDNQSNFDLGNLLPYPLELSYHWLDADTNKMKIFEGIRTQIRPHLLAKSKHQYQIDVIAPNIPGRYCLTIMLVQESVRWFDSMGPHHVLKRVVDVIG